MAKKVGFDYFTIDTDRYQDRRIKRLKKDFGCQGLAVYDYILCEIYRVRGCFLEWDNDTAFDVAEYFGLRESVVREIVQYCGCVGLFEKELLSRGIVTSAHIQQRYFEMCNRAKRPSIEIPEEIAIFTEKTQKFRKLSGKNAKIPEKTEKIPEKIHVSKVKYNITHTGRACARGQEDNFLDFEKRVCGELLSDTIACEDFCMKHGLGIEQMRAECDIILSEWALSRPAHVDEADVRKHLLSTLVFRFSEKRKKNGWSISSGGRSAGLNARIDDERRAAEVYADSIRRTMRDGAGGADIDGLL